MNPPIPIVKVEGRDNQVTSHVRLFFFVLDLFNADEGVSV